MANLYDHGYSLKRLVDGPQLPMYSHLTLARVSCESAAIVHYLLDQKISYDERVLRGSALILDSHGELLRQLEAQPDAVRQAIGSGPADDDAVFRSRLTKAGIEVGRTRRGQRREFELRLNGTSALLRPVLRDLVMLHFPDRPAVYSMQSGSVHSSSWLLKSLAVHSDSESLVLRAHPSETASAVLVTLEAIGVAVAAYARYYGHDGEAEARLTRKRVKAIDNALLDYWTAMVTAGRAEELGSPLASAVADPLGRHSVV